MKKYTFRSILCLCLCLAVFSAPLLSEARYRAYLNSFAAVVAKEYYFSSNYLREDGAIYTLTGWNGLTTSMDEISIRNHDNTLLANQSGQDLSYILTWDLKIYGPDEEELTNIQPFTLTVQYNIQKSTHSPGETQRVPEISETGATGEVRCKIAGDGNSKRDQFTLQINSPYLKKEESPLENGSYAELILTATNENSRNQYSRSISCKIRYIVSELEDFVKQFNVTESGNTVTTKIATNTIPGASNIQKVYLWWDTAVLKVDRFNHQFNQLFNEGKYKEVTSGDRTFGLLELSAGSLSSRTFQFEKLLTDFTFGDDGAHLLEGKKYDQATAEQYIGYYMANE